MMSKASSDKKNKGQSADSSNFYTRLIVFPHKRRQLVTYALVGFCILAFLIFNNQTSGNSWLIVLTPVLIVGAVIMMIPRSEDWEYKPWQSQPRQIERHQVERK